MSPNLDVHQMFKTSLDAGIDQSTVIFWNHIEMKEESMKVERAVD